MLSAYPTRHARIGNAVGLDTPASATALLDALREAGYGVGDGFAADGDALIGQLIAAGGYDSEWLTQQQLAAAPMRVPLAGTGSGSVRCRLTWRPRWSRTGASRPARCTPTAATSCWPGCGPATW